MIRTIISWLKMMSVLGCIAMHASENGFVGKNRRLALSHPSKLTQAQKAPFVEMQKATIDRLLAIEEPNLLEQEFDALTGDMQEQVMDAAVMRALRNWRALTEPKGALVKDLTTSIYKLENPPFNKEQNQELASYNKAVFNKLLRAKNPDEFYRLLYMESKQRRDFLKAWLDKIEPTLQNEKEFQVLSTKNLPADYFKYANGFATQKDSIKTVIIK